MSDYVSDPEIQIDGNLTESFYEAPKPNDRKRVANPQGVSVRLRDGNTWVLAHGCLSPHLLSLTDELFDKLVLTKSIQLGPVLMAAHKLLVVNYDLADAEVCYLLSSVEDKDEQERLDHDLAHAVMDSLTGPFIPRRTWSTWAMSSLYANGIEPMNVPPWLIPEVLHQLVATGRAMDRTEYIDSAAAASQRAELWARLPHPGTHRQHPSQPANGNPFAEPAESPPRSTPPPQPPPFPDGYKFPDGLSGD